MEMQWSLIILLNTDILYVEFSCWQPFKLLYVFFLQEIDDTDSCLDDSQEAYEGNKDAARAILRVKQKLDGYEDSEMRSVQGQVLSSLYWSIKIFIIYTPVTKVKFIFMFAF